MSVHRWITLMLILFICGCSREYLVWYGHSPNRLYRVEVIERNNRQQIKMGETLSQPYLGVALKTIVFSEDSRRFAYAAKTDEGWIVITDGEHSRPWTGIGEVLFGPKQQLVYVASDLGAWHVVVDGVPSVSFEAVMQGSLTFSPDGYHIAYVVAEGDQSRVVIDGKLGFLYESVAALRFSPDSQQIAYIVRNGLHQYIALDDKLLGPFNQIADFTIGRNGRLGILVRDHDGWRTVIDGQEGEVFDNLSSIQFSRNGQYAYAAERDNSWVVIQNGMHSPVYDSVKQLTFAEETLFYEASLGDDTCIVTNNIRGPLLKWVGRLIVSSDGLHVAYLGQPCEGSISVFHNTTVDAVPNAVSGSLVLSDDNQHWACLAQNEIDGHLDIVIDGQFRYPFDLEEMMALIMLTPDASSTQHEKMLRRWVKAELEHYYAKAALTQSSKMSKNSTQK